MNTPPGKTTFTLAEAAALLSCHRETLRRAIRNGKLQAAKLGRGWRISRADLENFWTSGGGGDLFNTPEGAQGEEASRDGGDATAPMMRHNPKSGRSTENG